MIQTEKHIEVLLYTNFYDMPCDNYSLRDAQS